MRLNQILILLAGIFTVAAAAGPAAKAKKLKARKIASIERTWQGGRVTGVLPRSEKDVSLRIGISSGYARTSTNVANTQAAREKSGQNQSASFGMNAHLDFLGYGFVDLDGFYAGSLSYKNVESLDRVTGTTESSSERVQSYGAMGEVGARIPMGRKSLSWTPTLAAGFGYLTTRDQKQSLTDTESAERTAVGPYVSAGLGVGIGSKFSLSGDAAVSVFAKGTADSGGSPTIVGGNDAISAQFIRFRVGAYYRISEPITFGVQYFQRRLNTQAAGESTPFKEKTDQVLGSMQFNF